MASFQAWSFFILVITSAVLFYAALTDLRTFTIRNELILTLLALFLLHAWVSGRWMHLHWNALMALAVFVFLLFAYTRNALGGGDVKLLTVGFLWVGYDCALPFALQLSVFAAIHLLVAKLGWARVRAEGKRQHVPYAPAIAAALIGTFMLGCLQPL
jgi:Flp pilus assembly protein protease CpaA